MNSTRSPTWSIRTLDTACRCHTAREKLIARTTRAAKKVGGKTEMSPRPDIRPGSMRGSDSAQRATEAAIRRHGRTTVLTIAEDHCGTAAAGSVAGTER